MKTMLLVITLLVSRVSMCQIISTVAGTGTKGFSGDSGLAIAAKLYYPLGVAVDASGNMYIADYGNSCIRKVNAIDGKIYTVAGIPGDYGYSGDGGLATTAQLHYPWSVAIDTAGNIFIADTYNHSIRKVNAVDGIISTIAGNGISGYAGDGDLATHSQLQYPYNLSVDDSENVFITDTYNQRIRKINATDGKINTVAGNGIAGYSGDSASALDAKIAYPGGVTTDKAGNIFICEGYQVRKVNAKNGNIYTIAGNHMQGYSGDGGIATAAELNNPQGICVDKNGNIFIADWGNSRIREVTASDNIINTVAGTGIAGYNGDNMLATTAELNFPENVCIDNVGNIFIADQANNRIRKITPKTLPVHLTYFTAEKKDKSILLKWQTAQELNTAYFEIEHNSNNNFVALSRMSSLGNSSQLQFYSFIDNTPLKGTNLYRLKQVDKDGNFSYSQIVSVTFDEDLFVLLFPNPVTDVLNIIGLKANTTSQLSIVNAKGSIVANTTVTEESYKWNLQSLSKGIYYLIIVSNNKTTTIKFVKE